LPKESLATTTPSQFKVGTEVQVKIRNNENRNLYVAVISIGSSGRLTPLFPYWDSAEVEAILAPNEERITPQEGDGYTFTLKGAGALEVLVLASAKPIRDALKGLKTIAEGGGIASRSPIPLEGDESLDLVQALLGDLDRNTRAEVAVTRNERIIAKSQLAAISTIVNVVES
jgi:hypothetical protein